ncbi:MULTISPECIES: hypothetical protein [unclassified Streptomyces]|uniref:hypothetical protein n=1 Tax=unclassified Streptomyces TaxID=2593676 RepID=UPI0035DF5B8E
MTVTALPASAGPHLWTPDQDPASLGALQVLGGLHITGLPALDAEEGDHPALFVLLGHHRWATTIHAAALYMDRAHAWTHWCLYPGDDPAETISRIPRAVHTHAVIHCHPDDAWRFAWARPDDPDALPVTAMRHPAAPAAAVAVPDPDRDDQAAAWAR